MSTDKPTPRGRIDWDQIRATSEQEKRRAAADDDRELGLDRSKLRYSPVFRVTSPDVRKLRAHLSLSQAGFAGKFGISVRTVQQWEQQRATPDQPAKILLRLIELAPDFVSHSIDDVLVEQKLSKTRIALSPITTELFARFLAEDRVGARLSHDASHKNTAAFVGASDPNAGAVYAAA